MPTPMETLRYVVLPLRGCRATGNVALVFGGVCHPARFDFVLDL